MKKHDINSQSSKFKHKYCDRTTACPQNQLTVIVVMHKAYMQRRQHASNIYSNRILTILQKHHSVQYAAINSMSWYYILQHWKIWHTLKCPLKT